MGDPIRRCLIIDDDESFRQLITRYLNLILPDTIVEEYDPSLSGAPPLDFDWSGCDLVILDYFLNASLTGLDLLNEWKKQPHFPPVIMLTAAGSEDVAVRAMKTGVQDYLRKQNITKEKLRQAIKDAVQSRRRENERRLASTHSSQSFNKSLFYKKLEEAPAAGQSSPVFFLIALDHFDAIGDEYGIIVQDNLLRQIARLTYKTFRAESYQTCMTRMSDATVALLFVPQPEQSLEQELQRLNQLLADDVFELDGKSIPYTVSIGAARLVDTDNTANAIIRAGRRACKQASQRGGNTFMIHQPGTPAPGTSSQPAPSGHEVREPHPTPAPNRQQAEPIKSTTDLPASKTPPTPPEPAEPRARQADDGQAIQPVAGKTATKTAGQSPSPRSADQADTAEPADGTGDDAAATPVNREPLSEQDLLEMTLELPVEKLRVDTAATITSEDKTDIRQAFADNRMLQYYQPIMPLSENASATEKEIYSIRIRMVDTNGEIIDAEHVMDNLKSARDQKLLDRWMLRQTVSRIVSHSHNGHRVPDFIIKLSEESFADANLFKWLQNKLMQRLGNVEPGKSVVIEIAAETYLAKTRQVDALVKFLRQSYGFRFALSSFSDTDQLNSCIDKGKFHFFKIDQKLLADIQSNQTDPTAIPEQVLRLKEKGVMVVATFIESAAMLTQAINCNADFAMGYFIGEPDDNIGGVSQIESYEIT